MKNIVLIGMPGAGKSTVGVLLAKSMLMNFCDTDLLIQNTTGKSLCDIIKDDGIEAFIKLEETIISDYEFCNSVVATGGSAVYGENAMKKLRENGVLGMNDRNYSVIAKYNKRSLYTLVDDKVKTKKLANSININTPHMIGIIEHQFQVKNILEIVKGYETFVIKPAHGSGGKGVLVIKKYDGEYFYAASGAVLTFKDIYQHIL